MKKTISVLLSLVLVLTFCIPAVHADAPAEEESCTKLYAPTVKRIIDTNLEHKDTNEEFFHLLADLYLTNPALLAEIISEYPSEDILYLVKAISYDLQKTGRANQATIPSNCSSSLVSAIAKLIYSRASNTQYGSIEAFYSEEILSFINALQSASVPADFTVSTPVVPSYYVYAPNSATATFNITTNNPSKADSYLCKLYMIRNGTTTLVSTKRVQRQEDISGVTVVMPVSYNVPGSYRFYVAVQSINGLAAQSPSSNFIYVTGQWTVTVELTTNRDQLGTITLYNSVGTEISSNICLGRSGSGDAMNIRFGNTPIGIYQGALGAIRYDKIESFGPYMVIEMYAVSGYIVTHTTRSAIMIHGGRPNSNTDVNSTYYPLYPTDGCIRIKNDYQNQITTEIQALIANGHSSTGYVIVTQNGLTDL